MKTAEQTHAQPKQASDDSALVKLLKENPDIFQREPGLLELVTLADTRGTPSLLEKQVETLKQRLHTMQSQQSDFIKVVRENEQISDSFSDVICKLIGYANLSEFAAEFPSALRSTFNIDEVAIKTVTGVAKRESEQTAFAAALQRLPHKRAVCDNRWPRAVMDLFFSHKIKSAALVPMKSHGDEVIGVLALGSCSEDRYTHELGTDHLTRLGLMAGICLDRLQPQKGG